jgi:hypothetical protein
MEICKKLVKYLWTHHKLSSIVILTSLVLIILGYGTEGGFLIGIYLIVNRIRSPDETIDELINDLIVLYIILELDRGFYDFDYFDDFDDFHHFHDSFNHSHHSHYF